MATTRFFIITGDRRAGKSTLAEELARTAREHGKAVGGIIAQSMWSLDGAKLGIQAVDLGTGETKRLATIVHSKANATVGEYMFNPENTAWALERMKQALSSQLDVVIIDEIGRLELCAKGGYVDLLPMLQIAVPRIVLIIVRDQYVDTFCDQTGITPERIIQVTQNTRDTLTKELTPILLA